MDRRGIPGGGDTRDLDYYEYNMPSDQLETVGHCNMSRPG